MNHRPFAPFAMLSVVLGIACVDQVPAPVVAASPFPAASSSADESPKALLKRAIETAENGEFAQAVSLSEKAVAAAPDDRDALFLLGAMSLERADQVDEKAEKVALFRRASEVLGKLAKNHKELRPQEQAYLARAKYGDARAAALDGKPTVALAALKELVAQGLDDIDMIEGNPELRTVVALPEYAALKASVMKQMKVSVAKELAESKSFPFDFALKDLDDKPVKLADFKGKVTIVDVWGTWCPPCRMEIPHFVALYNDLHAKGLEIVGINCNEGDDKATAIKTVKQFVAAEKIPYPCVLNDETTERKIPDFQGYPTTLFLDRSGKVRMTLVGLTSRPKLEAIVETLLAEPTTP